MKKNKLNTQFKTTLLLLTMLLTGFFAFYLPMETPDSHLNSRNKNDINSTNNDLNPIETPKLSLISSDSWWDDSFRYRCIINITNQAPNTAILENFVTYMSFNYTEFVNAEKMQSSLNDVRIVKNDKIQKYYIKKDFNGTKSQAGIATVYFQTNTSAYTTYTDTFLYYGNSTCGPATDYLMDNNFGMISYWGFEDGTGSTTTDDTIKNNDGTLTDMNPSNDWVSGRVDDFSLDFDGSNDYVNIPDDSSLTVTTALTITFWAYRRTSDAWEVAVGNGGGWSQNGYHVMSSGGGRYRFEIQNRTDNAKEMIDTYGTSGVVQNNEWHMITATYDGYYMSFYIDKAENIKRDITQTSGGTNDVTYIGDSDNDLHIGWHDYGGEYFDGVIDDVKIYNYAFSADDVEQTYNNTELKTILNEEQGAKVTVKVIAKDLYGNTIPYVNISMYNNSAIVPLIKSDIAGSDGSVDFDGVDFGNYNFTVSMTSSADGTSITKLVNETSTPYDLQGSQVEITLICNVSSNFFYIKDVDGGPVESGYILVGNHTPGFGIIQNCTIDTNGYARFWWVNATPYGYNYSVQYRNNDYNPKEVILAKGEIDTPDKTYTIFTNLTTVNFTISAGQYADTPISGAKLILKQISPAGASIVNLTTDSFGKATLRWVNSSGLLLGQKVNYSLQIDYSGIKVFNHTIDGWTPSRNEIDFTVSSKTSYDLRMNLNIEDYKTEMILLNPTEDFEITWGTQLLLRCIFNVTHIGDGDDTALLGFKYADSMTYTILKENTEIISNSIPYDPSLIGRYKGTINTELLEVDTYIIEISALKSGFSLPEKLSLVLEILDNDMLINQSENDDSATEVYWLENADMSVKPYGQNSENFIVEGSLFKTANNNDYDFDFWVPELSTDWNLSQIVFNVNDITFGAGITEDDVNITITNTDYNVKYTWDKNNGTLGYYDGLAINGSWSNLIFDLSNKKSLTNDNTFNFQIDGIFTGAVNVVAIGSFVRDKINVELRRFNVTNDINILSDENGWAIKNITFLIENCRNRNTGQTVNPADVIENITTNEGVEYKFLKGKNDGTGNLTIDDRIIYPLDGQFLFIVGNLSNIVFDLIVKIEYFQGFYSHKFLEIYNYSKSEQGIQNAEVFQISYDGDWTSQGVSILVEELRDGASQYVYPSEVGLNLTIGSTTYYFNEYGILLIENIGKNDIIQATIYANQLTMFNLYFTITYSRTVSYEISGDIQYKLREAPEKTGDLIYNEDLNCYQVSITTTDIDADDYIVWFIEDIDHYGMDQYKDLDLIVNGRLTTLNGYARPTYTIVKNIYIKDIYNFTFTYLDSDFGTPITSVDEQSWSLWSGNTLLESGNLVHNSQNQYVFDFNTETRNIGTYSLSIVMAKRNYETKSVEITLTISLRTFENELGDEFEDKQANVVKGEKLTIQITLTDPTKANAPLTGATVILEIGDDELKFEEVEAGVYELEFDTDDYEAFFSSNTLTGTIKISKADYISDEIDITIVVEMEEITDGVPTFYFMLAVGAIIGLIGALTSYRVVQVLRIPKFVKKVRKFKKAMKSKDKIGDSLLYPLRENFMAERYGDNFKALGLSASEIFGTKAGKGPMKPKEGEQ